MTARKKDSAKDPLNWDKAFARLVAGDETQGDPEAYRMSYFSEWYYQSHLKSTGEQIPLTELRESWADYDERMDGQQKEAWRGAVSAAEDAIGSENAPDWSAAYRAVALYVRQHESRLKSIFHDEDTIERVHPEFITVNNQPWSIDNLIREVITVPLAFNADRTHFAMKTTLATEAEYRIAALLFRRNHRNGIVAALTELEKMHATHSSPGLRILSEVRGIIDRSVDQKAGITAATGHMMRLEMVPLGNIDASVRRLIVYIAIVELLALFDDAEQALNGHLLVSGQFIYPSPREESFATKLRVAFRTWGRWALLNRASVQAFLAADPAVRLQIVQDLATDDHLDDERAVETKRGKRKPAKVKDAEERFLREIETRKASRKDGNLMTEREAIRQLIQEQRLPNLTSWRSLADKAYAAYEAGNVVLNEHVRSAQDRVRALRRKLS